MAKYLIFVILFCSCTTDVGHDTDTLAEENISATFEEKLQLSEIDEINFPLDSLISFESNSIYPFEKNGISYVSILNNIEPSIYIYNYNDRRLSNKIKLYKDGPNGIKRTDDKVSHMISNNGNVYIINSWISKIFVFNFQGELIDSFTFMELREKYLANIFSSSTHPMRIIEDHLYIPLYCMGPNSYEYDYTKVPTCLKLNLINRSITPLFNLSTVYNKYWYGETPFKYWSNYVYNADQKSFVVNYSVDPNLSIFKNEKLIDKKYIGSQYFESIQPLFDDMPTKPISNFGSIDRQYALTNPDFNLFVFDEASQKYIRMVYLRPSVEDYKRGITLPHFSFIIFDRSFKKLGETKLNGGIYRPYISFVNKHGLHIARYDKFARNEDELTFGVFKISEM